jgi:hypothetical protein
LQWAHPAPMKIPVQQIYSKRLLVHCIQLRIPAESGHRFRLIPATQSGGIRPPVPVESGQAVRANPATIPADSAQGAARE